MNQHPYTEGREICRLDGLPLYEQNGLGGLIANRIRHLNVVVKCLLFVFLVVFSGGPFFSSPDSVVAHGLYSISFYSCTKESKVGRKRAANLNTSAGKPSSNNGFDAFERDGQGHQVRSCWVVPNRIKTRLLFYFDFICFSIFFFIFILTCSFPFLSLADGWTLLLGLPRT